MISFACAGCGQKLQVPDEVAGQSVRCSICKHVMTIAAPASLATTVGLAPIAGQPSSLARAGHNGGVTVGAQDAASTDESPTNSPGLRSLREILSNGASGGERYQVAGEIARGGMGAVLRAVDCDIRREVAVKYLLDQADPRKKARFVEEAQITGQLEHPNIVPIHELGVDADHRLFFSMKLVNGRSLQQVLAELRDTPRSAEKEYSLTRLMAVVVSICHALAYAHSRGVIHRDLKPANIMLGDFGEVYVMDWGLAKLLQRAAAAEQPAGVLQTTPSFAWADEAASASPSGAVQTNRVAEDDKTVDGTIMGTPLYMPPEQALGDIAAIDQRSDIYSLGAILYEMLTLQPPIDKQGGPRAVLLRVSQGEIVPPQQRDPARTKAGKVPKELAAVVRKALARDKAERYATVEAFRLDIERYLEGRSVSARVDSKREMLVRLVKRNKTASLSAAVVLLVLATSMGFIVKAWLETYRTNAAYRSELEEKQRRTKRAVPAFVRAARQAANEGQLDEAQAQLDFALEYDPDNLDARLLKGQVLLARKDWSAGRAVLQEYLSKRPRDGDARKLLQLSEEGRVKDPANLVALTEVFQRQKVFGLAVGLLQDVQRTVEARQPLLPLYRKQIEAAMPGLGERLSLQADGQFNLNLASCQQIASLQSLKGMPIHILNIYNCPRITDLTPLEGMPLTSLNLDEDPVQDLSPLKGMPLTKLSAQNTKVRDLTPLAGMRLTELSLHNTPVRDLTPLKGMPLTRLNLQASSVEDLTPLKGMSLTVLLLLESAVSDLTPLAGMRLEEIGLDPRRMPKEMFVLRRMESLKTIYLGNNLLQPTPPAEFWKKYDAGEFRQPKP